MIDLTVKQSIKDVLQAIKALESRITSLETSYGHNSESFSDIKNAALKAVLASLEHMLYAVIKSFDDYMDNTEMIGKTVDKAMAKADDVVEVDENGQYKFGGSIWGN
jgi:two-component sensor histidine kinase